MNPRKFNFDEEDDYPNLELSSFTIVVVETHLRDLSIFIKAASKAIAMLEVPNILRCASNCILEDVEVDDKIEQMFEALEEGADHKLSDPRKLIKKKYHSKKLRRNL